jgi:hypothetical protein
MQDDRGIGHYSHFSFMAPIATDERVPLTTERLNIWYSGSSLLIVPV